MRRVLLVVGGLILVYMAAWHLYGWRAEQKIETQPQVLEQTKKAKKAHRRKLTREQAAELCSGLAPIEREPVPLRVSRHPNRHAVGGGPEPLVRGMRLGIEDQVPALLDSLKIEKLPYGGSADVELAIGAERPIVTVYPNPRPWLEAGSRWRLSALVGVPLDGEIGNLSVVPRIDWRALRTGRIDYGGAVTYCPARSVIGGVVVGIE